MNIGIDRPDRLDGKANSRCESAGVRAVCDCDFVTLEVTAGDGRAALPLTAALVHWRGRYNVPYAL